MKEQNMSRLIAILSDNNFSSHSYFSPFPPFSFLYCRSIHQTLSGLLHHYFLTKLRVSSHSSNLGEGGVDHTSSHKKEFYHLFQMKRGSFVDKDFSAFISIIKRIGSSLHKHMWPISIIQEDQIYSTSYIAYPVNISS